MRPLVQTTCGVLLVSGALWVGLGADLGLGVGTPRAEVVDPAVGTVVVTSGAAVDRMDSARDGRVAQLPVAPSRRWVRTGGAIGKAPAVLPNTIVMVTGSSVASQALVELSIRDGLPKITTPLEASVGLVSAPVLAFPGGVRVVATSFAVIGFDETGKARFRAPYPSATMILPTPSGNIAVLRSGEIVVIDTRGQLVDRLTIDAQGIAVRSQGEVLSVNRFGDLWAWAPGKVSRLVGSFEGRECKGGIAIDQPDGGTTKRRERAICVSDGLIESIDIVSGTRQILLRRGLQPYRTAAAVSVSGDVLTVGAGAELQGVSGLGSELGTPTVGPALGFGSRDSGGFLLPSSSGEVAPIVDRSSQAAFASSEGLMLGKAGAPPVTLMRCGGSSVNPVVGLASSLKNTLVVTCLDGRVELWADKDVTL